MKLIIVGGGIGGVAAAIALVQSGHQVTVLERAPTISEIGAGVQISPNGMKVLDWLGVTPALESTLFEPEAIELCNGDSEKRIFYLPMKGFAEKRWGARFVQVHRADLLAALLKRLDDLAPGCVKVGSTVLSYENGSTGAAAILEGGKTLEADLIIGADGLHSKIRTQMLGAEQPRFTGNIAWRALVPVSDLGNNAPPSHGRIWAGDCRHAVTTRIRSGDVVNFVGVIERPEPIAEGWDVTGAGLEAKRDFGNWNKTIDAILENAPKLNCWALYDRAPLKRWHDGHVALLGDAAHPMLPSMAQGAVQALEDAYVLADCLQRQSDVTKALATYYAERIDRTSRIQARSAQNVRLFHRGGAFAKNAFYGPLSVVGRTLPEFLHRQNDWIYGGGPLGRA